MHTELQLILSPEQANDENIIKSIIAEKLNTEIELIADFRILKKSIDARSANPKINMSLAVFMTGEEIPPIYTKSFVYQNVADKEPVLIVGAGPSGLFAALKLLELGLKPILLERGKKIEERVEDVHQLTQADRLINTESNFGFGEGGAGTFSDGKLLTRSKRKGSVQGVLETFHYHGAKDSILYDSNPQIGFDVLPQIINHMRQTILSYGGEIHHEKQMTEIIIDNKQVRGCITADGTQYHADNLILATGQSAADIYELLDKQAISLESKAFALGVRVEHSQALINQIQYHNQKPNALLPPAIYNLTERIQDRSVYSFCMCPGGEIVPAMTANEEIVVNGMSSSKRDSAFANAGFVVEIRPEDIPTNFQQYGVFAGLKYRQHLENLAFVKNEANGIAAPAQRLVDFIKGITSIDLPANSYKPGLISSPLHQWLPAGIYTRLREAFLRFDRKMQGFLSNDAVVVGVETRSSSTLRIPRDHHTGEHPEVQGLFPAGEGSGHSGGITSSAMDGEWIAEMVYNKINAGNK